MESGTVCLTFFLVEHLNIQIPTSSTISYLFKVNKVNLTTSNTARTLLLRQEFSSTQQFSLFAFGV